MKRGTIIFILLTLCAAGFTQKDSLYYFPGQISIIFPIGTSGSQSMNYKYTSSINLFQGATGAIEGIEFGGLVNTNKLYMQGAQFAGIANITGTYVNGGQFAGICNMAGGSVTGAQFAGILNSTPGNVDGMQIGGISNLSGGKAKVQLAGISNHAQSIDGIQASGIINQAGYVKGFQLAGIVNVCDSIDGIPLAVVSIVKHGGYRQFELSTSEAFHTNLSFKIGVQKLYTIFSIAYKTGDRDNNMGFGLGLGTHTDLGLRSGLDLELQTYHISRFLWMDEDNFMYSLRLNYEYKLTNQLAVFAGPSLNMLHAVNSSDADDIAPGYSAEYSNYYDWKYWLGFNAGIRF